MPNDNPIENLCDDVLGRAEVAESFAQHVLALDATEGAVVGVFGPWGSGKTSFLNLAKAPKYEPSAHVVHFNPWLFSGTEQLIHQFFSSALLTISETLRLPKFRRKIARKVIKDYADRSRTYIYRLPLLEHWV